MDMQFAVTWSHSQQCAHIESVRTMLAVNRRNWAFRRGTDYVVIALCDTRTEADAVVDALHSTRDRIDLQANG